MTTDELKEVGLRALRLARAHDAQRVKIELVPQEVTRPSNLLWIEVERRVSAPAGVEVETITTADGEKVKDKPTERDVEWDETVVIRIGPRSGAERRVMLAVPAAMLEDGGER